MAHPPRRVKRWTEADVDQGVEAELVRLFDRLYQLQPGAGDDGETRPELVRLAPDAKRLWVSFYNAHADELAGEVGDLAAAFSKLEEAAARLALVVHCARWAAGGAADGLELDAESMRAGVTLAEWFRHEARRVYALLDESDDARDRRHLAELIQARGGRITVRELMRCNCRRYPNAAAAEAALEGLVKSGLARWAEATPRTRAVELRMTHDTYDSGGGGPTVHDAAHDTDREPSGELDANERDERQGAAKEGPVSYVSCVMRDEPPDAMAAEAGPVSRASVMRDDGGPGGPSAAPAPPGAAPTPPVGARLRFADTSWRPCGRDDASWWTWEGATSWLDAADHPPPAGGG